jgi:hypothetical protein
MINIIMITLHSSIMNPLSTSHFSKIIHAVNQGDTKQQSPGQLCREAPMLYVRRGYSDRATHVDSANVAVLSWITPPAYVSHGPIKGSPKMVVIRA